MKILLAIEQSSCSRCAIEEVARRPWPEDSELKVVAAVNPVFGDEADGVTKKLRDDVAHVTRRQAEALLKDALGQLGDTRHVWASISADVVEGPAPYAIVDAAERWGADLIVMGTHGEERFFLGSVAHAVSVNAPCSVEVVRERRPTRR